jgi:hypothetical protein
MATGRDAADVAMTTSFGMAELIKFSVVTNEVRDGGPLQELGSSAAGSGGSQFGGFSGHRSVCSPLRSARLDFIVKTRAR